jgi:hypothetical protein
MTASVLAACRDEEITSEPSVFAREFANRKVMRFLDDVALKPFITIVELRNRFPDVDPHEVAVFTISTWEADVVNPDVTPGPGESQAYAMSRHLYEHGNPTEWLRHMPNNTICQAAISREVRGANAHYAGDGASVIHSLLVADQALVTGDARVAIVAAFDQAPGGEASAVGLALGLGRDGSRPWIDQLSPSAAAGTGALDTLAACLAAVEQCRSEQRSVPVELNDQRVCVIHDPAEPVPEPV